MKPNAVYVGSSLSVCAGGTEKRHLFNLKGIEGFAEEVLDQWYFQPEIRPIPESVEEAEVMRLYYQGKEMTVAETKIWEGMVDSVTFRVKYEDLYLLDG